MYGTFNSNRHLLPWGDTVHFDLAIDNPSVLLETTSPDRVIHTAAIARTEACHRDPEAAHRVNVIGTEKLAAACGARRIPLIFLSTDMVFNGKNPPYAEQALPNPETVYGRTKLAAEEAVRARHPDATIVRANLVYGHGIGWGTSFSEWIRISLKKNGSIELFEDQYRSPISVRNLVDVLLEMCESPPRRLLHVSGPDRVSRRHFGQALARTLGIDPDTIRANRLQDHPSDIEYPIDTSYDIALARSTIKTELLGIEPGLELEYVTSAEAWIGKERAMTS